MEKGSSAFEFTSAKDVLDEAITLMRECKAQSDSVRDVPGRTSEMVALITAIRHMETEDVIRNYDFG